jgi:hypothetical protein
LKIDRGSKRSIHDPHIRIPPEPSGIPIRQTPL